MAHEFKVTIAAVDKASVVLRAFRMNMSKEARAFQEPLLGFSKPYMELGHSLYRFGRASGLFSVARGAAAATRGVVNVGRGITRLAGSIPFLGTALGALGLGALGHEFVSLARGAADYGEEIGVKTNVAEVLAGEKQGAGHVYARPYLLLLLAQFQAEFFDHLGYQCIRLLDSLAWFVHELTLDLIPACAELL